MEMLIRGLWCASVSAVAMAVTMPVIDPVRDLVLEAGHEVSS